MGRLKQLTSAPLATTRTCLTVGPRGPLLVQDVHLQEQMQHFTRECIPERDPRGFALKLYVGEGNWNLVGNDTSVFFTCAML